MTFPCCDGMLQRIIQPSYWVGLDGQIFTTFDTWILEDMNFCPYCGTRVEGK